MDTFVTALYVKIDDTLRDTPYLRLCRSKVGTAPKLSDAELITIAVVQVLLGFTSETRFLRYAAKHLRSWFPCVPGQSGYNKRLLKSATQLRALTRISAKDSDLFFDDTWVVNSTPVECGRSLETAKRSDLVGFATYGYCASHSRYFCGLRLHLVCTPKGLPITFALADAKADERQIIKDLVEIEPDLVRPGHVILADKGYASTQLGTFMAERGATLIRRAKAGEPPRPGARFLKALRQIIESINDTLKSQLDSDRHGGYTQGGVVTRVIQRIVAMTAAIWHNHHCEVTPVRSLIAYDHG